MPRESGPSVCSARQAVNLFSGTGLGLRLEEFLQFTCAQSFFFTKGLCPTKGSNFVPIRQMCVLHDRTVVAGPTILCMYIVVGRIKVHKLSMP